EAWAEVMTEAFEQLQDDLDDGKRTVLDAYAATNEAEFFAVATETFFEKPRRLARKHPDLYAVLRDYYRQDPLERLDRARRSQE
ncbi:MAG: zinc-dependent peptidase, partial [Planctomycetota bacterium]|nr:zinc-dependent peptidase [Planctomycetota bacterium]